MNNTARAFTIGLNKAGLTQKTAAVIVDLYGEANYTQLLLLEMEDETTHTCFHSISF